MTAADQPTLWAFATHCYAQPGISEQCLRWQDGGADVCLLLCAAWLERRNAPWTAARQAQLAQLAHDWQVRVVGPLRSLRRSWKDAALSDTGLAELRAGVQRLELDAERELLGRLEAITAPWPAGQQRSAWLEHLLPAPAEARPIGRLRDAARVSYSAG